MDEYITLSEAANLLGKNKETLRRWDREGKLCAVREPISNYRVYRKADVTNLFGDFFDLDLMDETSNFEPAEHDYKVLELFAGAGGLAVGLEQSGLECIALNELDKFACATLRKNRPNWEVLEGDI
jgi:DNA (cytosine-5)-methyltransferase 1